MNTLESRNYLTTEQQRQQLNMLLNTDMRKISPISSSNTSSSTIFQRKALHGGRTMMMTKRIACNPMSPPSCPVPVSPELSPQCYPKPPSQRIQSLSLPLSSLPLHSKRKAVHFGKRILVKEIRHRRDMHPKICDAVWISQNEYLEIRSSLKQTIRLMMAGKRIDEDVQLCEQFCSRGLERRTRKGQSTRNQVRTKCKGAVFFEQEHQRRTGKRDAVRLAVVSSKMSAGCVGWAKLKALENEQEAKQYLF